MRRRLTYNKWEYKCSYKVQTYTIRKILYCSLEYLKFTLMLFVCEDMFDMTGDNIQVFSLRKHTYSNIQKISSPKTENFQIKNPDIFHISDQNIYCGYSLEPPRRGGSNEYPQSMFLSRNKKNNVYPCKPQFYYIKVGFKGVKFI